MLELKNVSKYYNNNGVVSLGLRNINLKLNKGEIVAITGDSGSGKSTLLNVITGVDTYEDGEILFYGNETSYFNQDDMDLFRKNNVSFIYQKYNIIESYTVLQNIMLPLLMSGKSTEDAKKQAKEIAKKVGLEKRINNKGSKLSGGEKQRCVIARALASDSKILACDEPTGNLDSETGDKIIELIKEVADDKLVLIVTHNYDQVKDIVTRKIKISDGEIVEDTTFKKVDEKEEQKLNLTDSKIKKRVLNKIAFQNVFSTPNKTTLVSLVFFFIALITLALSTLMMQQSRESKYTSNNQYSIVSDDRIIIYDKEHNKLDKSKLEALKSDEIKYNAFYEEVAIPYSNTNRYSGRFKTTDRKINYKIAKGRDMEKDGEFVLVLPNSLPVSRYLDFNDAPLYVAGDNYFLFGEEYKKHANIGTVTGIAKSKEIKDPYIVCYGEVPQQVKNIVNFKSTTFTYEIDGIEKNIHINESFDNILNKTTIYVPTSLKNKFNYSAKIKGLYNINFSNIDIKYEDNITSPFIEIGSDSYIGDIDGTIDGVYEATAYESNLNKIKNNLKSLGYIYTIPSQLKSDNSINLAIFYFFLFLILIALVLLFFISFAILSRIYSSKSNDYSILRALGMVQKDLGSIVRIETIFLSAMSSLVALIVFTIITVCVPSIILEKFLTLPLILIFLATMILFAFFIANRFNRKLFRFSVNTSMKEGALND